jgi:predicted enzyme related to lactoylglutathione lyase
MTHDKVMTGETTQGGTMARIVHIAVKVDDLEKATEFYEKGF